MRRYSPRLATCCLTALLAIAAQPVAAATSASDTALRMEDARARLRQGEPRAAMIILKDAVKADPSNGSARYELGLMHLRLGDNRAAEKEFRQAREKGVDAILVAPALAQTYLVLRKYDTLLAELTDCPEPTCKAQIMAARSRAFLALNRPAEAEHSAAAALTAAPDDVSAQLAVALIAMLNNDTQRAERLVDQVLTANPHDAEALSLHGDLRRMANDDAGASAAYTNALKSNPRDGLSRQKLIMVLLAMGRTEEARAQVEHLLRQSPATPQMLYIKAMVAVRLNNYSEALEAIRPVEEDVSRLPNGTYLLAAIHAGNNNLENARSYADRLIATQPGNLSAAKLAAQIYGRRNEYHRIVSLLSPLRSQLTGDPAGMELLGSALLAEGRPGDAQEVLAEAARFQPNNDMAKARLALSQIQVANTHAIGMRDLQAVVQSNPVNYNTGLMLVLAHMRDANYAKAAEVARSMAAANPRAPQPMLLEGAALMASGELNAARTSVSRALSLDPNFIPAAISLAEIEMRAGDPNAARAHLDDMLTRHPRDPRVLIARSHVEIRSGSPGKAATFIERAIAATPEDALPRMRLIEALMAANERERATQAATELVGMQPKEPAALDLAAGTLLALGQTDKALAAYRQLTKLVPDQPNSHHRLAIALAGRGQNIDAQQALDRALALDGSNAAAWQLRVELERRNAGIPAALAVAEMARKRAPDAAWAVYLDGDVLAAANRPAEAETAWRTAFARSPAGEGALRLFHAAISRGDRNMAQALLAEWLKKKPDDHSVRLTLADDMMVAGNLKPAIAHYHQLLQNLPLSPVVLNNLAWAYDKLGDGRAVEFARKAYDLAPTSPEIIDTYAYLLYRQADRTQGAKLIELAFAGKPRNPSIAYHTARIRMDRNDRAGAQQALQQIDAKAVFDEAEDARLLNSQLGGT